MHTVETPVAILFICCSFIVAPGIVSMTLMTILFDTGRYIILVLQTICIFHVFMVFPWQQSPLWWEAEIETRCCCRRWLQSVVVIKGAMKRKCDFQQQFNLQKNKQRDCCIWKLSLKLHLCIWVLGVWWILGMYDKYVSLGITFQ